MTTATRGVSEDVIELHGGCHCGGVRYTLDWPASAAQIAARRCGCTFCRKHGGVWTSHPRARLRVAAGDAPTSRYRFGTKTADFHVCARCGVVPFVSCEIDGRTYAVVNVNALEDMPGVNIAIASSDFDGEGVGDRLERRRRHWIAEVSGIA